MGNPKVTPLVEAFHDGGFLVSVGNGHQSFSQGLLTGGSKVLAGTVLGLITAALTASAVALGTNTGNGTFGAITPVATPTQIGVYGVSYTDATHFTVTAPDGLTSAGVNATPFSALGVVFTMTTGGTPMVAGDGFTLTATATPGKPTLVSAANAGNIGNSTMGTISGNGYAAVAGQYTVEFDDATHFILSDPSGSEVGHGTTGVAFVGPLGFTITAGGTAFVPGDSFTIALAAGSGSYKPWDPGSADGSQIACAILYAQKDVTLADKQAAFVDGQAEVNLSELVYPTGLGAVELGIMQTQLKAVGIRCR
jgi:hypothetical protein